MNWWGTVGTILEGSAHLQLFLSIFPIFLVLAL